MRKLPKINPYLSLNLVNFNKVQVESQLNKIIID